MIEIYGLNSKFKKYLDLLDEALLRLSARDDPFSGVLEDVQRLISQDKSLSLKALNDFFNICRQFRKTQFSCDVINKNKDIEKTWLPLIILGQDWNDVLKSIYGYILPSELKSCSRIILTPIKKNKNISVSIQLKDKFQISNDEFDEIFYSYIKSEFNLKIDNYNVDEQILYLGNNQIIEIPLIDGEKLISGSLPKTIEYLLRWGSIKNLRIEYPLEDSIYPKLNDVISSVVVVPLGDTDFWKKNIEGIWNELFSLLNILPQKPIHLIISSGAAEFYPIIEKMVHDMFESHDLIFEYSDDEFEKHFLARHFTFLGKNYLRTGSEYTNLLKLFQKFPGDDSNIETQLIPNSASIVEKKYLLSKNILERIGNILFLRSFSKILLTVGSNAQEELKNALLKTKVTNGFNTGNFKFNY